MVLILLLTFDAVFLINQAFRFFIHTEGRIQFSSFKIYSLSHFASLWISLFCLWNRTASLCDVFYCSLGLFIFFLLLTCAINPDVHSVENLCVLNIQQANPAKNATCINNGADENEWKKYLGVKAVYSW